MNSPPCHHATTQATYSPAWPPSIALSPLSIHTLLTSNTLHCYLPSLPYSSIAAFNFPAKQPEQDMEYDFDVSTAERFTTASVPVTTASATPEVSTTAANLVYIRRSGEKRKDKGKAIMKEDESVQKKTKKQLEQERLGHEEAIRLQEQINEKENQRIARDAEIAKHLQE
ncbi:hypothetical protein Tco_1518066 [Tanacetum coccineum]